MQDPGAAEKNNDGITAGFTYLGQFIDHDLTLDTQPQPTTPIDPTTLTNHRTFFFDLDSVFGGGLDGSPQLYESGGEHMLITGDGVTLRDLPRNADGSAILVEHRNDENQIIAQIHLAFLQFYNQLIDAGYTHRRARRVTTEYYQWVVLHDFLPHLVGQDRVDSFFNPDGSVKKEFFQPRREGTPVEFSIAAYRFGHSQVRNAYALNDSSGFIPVFSTTTDDLHGGRPITEGRTISWGRFFGQLAGPGVTPNISRQVDTLVSASLFNLPIPGAADTGSNNLAFRNMLRAMLYGLPSGQAVAHRLGEIVLEAKDINPTGLPPGDPKCPVPTTPPPFAASLDEGTPLWFYILAESQLLEAGTRLGPVGARIVTEIFVRQLQHSTPSILRSGFVPEPPIAPSTGEFTMADFLVFAGVTE